MAEKKIYQAYLDAAAEAEVGGALAVSRNPKHRGAKMTASGMTTAQLRVVLDYAHRLVAIMKSVGSRKTLHIGKATLQLTERGREEILAMRGV